MGDLAEPPAGDFGDELDRVIRALSDKHRRYLLYTLSDSEGTAPLFDLVLSLTEWDGALDTSTAEVTMIHRHIPNLEAADLIEYDPHARVLSLTHKGEIANAGRAAYLSVVRSRCC